MVMWCTGGDNPGIVTPMCSQELERMPIEERIAVLGRQVRCPIDEPLPLLPPLLCRFHSFTWDDLALCPATSLSTERFAMDQPFVLFPSRGQAGSSVSTLSPLLNVSQTPQTTDQHLPTLLTSCLSSRSSQTETRRWTRWALPRTTSYRPRRRPLRTLPRHRSHRSSKRSRARRVPIPRVSPGGETTTHCHLHHRTAPPPRRSPRLRRPLARLGWAKSTLPRREHSKSQTTYLSLSHTYSLTQTHRHAMRNDTTAAHYTTTHLDHDWETPP